MTFSGIRINISSFPLKRLCTGVGFGIAPYLATYILFGTEIIDQFMHGSFFAERKVVFLNLRRVTAVARKPRNTEINAVNSYITEEKEAEQVVEDAEKKIYSLCGAQGSLKTKHTTCYRHDRIERASGHLNQKIAIKPSMTARNSGYNECFCCTVFMYPFEQLLRPQGSPSHEAEDRAHDEITQHHTRGDTVDRNTGFVETLRQMLVPLL